MEYLDTSIHHIMIEYVYTYIIEKMILFSDKTNFFLKEFIYKY